MILSSINLHYRNMRKQSIDLFVYCLWFVYCIDYCLFWFLVTSASENVRITIFNPVQTLMLIITSEWCNYEMLVLRNRVATSAMNFYKFIFTHCQTSAEMTRVERSHEENVIIAKFIKDDLAAHRRRRRRRFASCEENSVPITL